MMGLNVNVYDHAPFMREVAELLEDLLGRPVYEIEDWHRVIAAARDNLHALRQPVAAECHCEACWLKKHSA